jgi:transcriptional/translational regulatory protein YebC/TACO1
MFDHVGQFFFGPDVSEDAIMTVALDNGASDIITDDDGVTEVLCDPADFEALQAAFVSANLTPEEADITMRGQNDIELSGDDALKMQKILDMLEDLDDVQQVYTNAVMDIG